MSNFDKQAILEKVNQLTYTRLQSLGIHEEEINGLAEFIFSYNAIAVDLLDGEPGIQLPDATEIIPLTDQNALQASTLFAEGIIFTLLRIQEYKIPGDLINPLAQQVAMPVYEQAKQIVAATHGQEHTPEFQISPEQQAEYISQAAESALLHFINEYEKQNGPINPDPEPEQQGNPIEPSPAQPAADPYDFMAPEAEPSWDDPAAAIGPDTYQPSQSPAHQAPPSHEKFAAVALLLTTLSAQQRARVLNSFAPEEKELIAFYSHPQHVEQNLDTGKVAAHLQKLKAHFSKREKNPSSKRIATLIGLISQEKLLSCVKDERPVVTRYLMAHSQSAVEQADADPTSIPPLSSRLEDIIYQYLTRRLVPELKQALHSEG